VVIWDNLETLAIDARQVWRGLNENHNRLDRAATLLVGNPQRPSRDYKALF
jgi:hypothetical protein